MADYDGYTGEEIYCICRSTDCSRFMIGCDGCDEWFHGDCIGVKAEDANYIEKFFCKFCRNKDPGLQIVYKKKKDKHRDKDRHERHKEKHRDKSHKSSKHRDDHREKREEKHKHKVDDSSDFDDFIKKMKAKSKDKDRERASREEKSKKSSRRCGNCVGCSTLEDCGKCDFCKDMRKFGGPNKIRQKCRQRQCRTFGITYSKLRRHEEDEGEQSSYARTHSGLVKDPEVEAREKEAKEQKERERKEREREKKERQLKWEQERHERERVEREQAERLERERRERQELREKREAEEAKIRQARKIDSDTDSGKEEDPETQSSQAENIPSPATPAFLAARAQAQQSQQAWEHTASDSDSDWEQEARVVKKDKREGKRKYTKRGKGAETSRKPYTKRAKKLEVYTYEEYTQESDEESQIKQCYGPGCTEAARQGSKYCSDECGLKLATNRIFEILPQRIQTWHQSPCQAEMNNKKHLEKIRQQILQAKKTLEELEAKLQNLNSLLEKAKHLTIAKNIDSQDDETEAENSIFCVTCGHEINQRTAIKHMEKCFQKFESLTSFGSSYRSRIEGGIFCDNYNHISKTYCKRLKVLCPEHSKQPKVSAEEVCGCPLLGAEFKENGEFCRTGKKKCNKHPGWENMRRAEIDLEKLRQWMKLEELFEQERTTRSAMTARAGVMGLMLHQTMDHDALKPIIKIAN